MTKWVHDRRFFDNLQVPNLTIRTETNQAIKFNLISRRTISLQCSRHLLLSSMNFEAAVIVVRCDEITNFGVNSYLYKELLLLPNFAFRFKLIRAFCCQRRTKLLALLDDQWFTTYKAFLSFVCVRARATISYMQWKSFLLQIVYTPYNDVKYLAENCSEETKKMSLEKSAFPQLTDHFTIRQWCQNNNYPTPYSWFERESGARDRVTGSLMNMSGGDAPSTYLWLIVN